MIVFRNTKLITVLKNTVLIGQKHCVNIVAHALLTGHVAGSPGARRPGDIWLRRQPSP